MNKRIILLPLLLCLCSCGNKVKDFVNGKIDNSPFWDDNYYDRWDEGLRDIEFASSSERYLDENDMVFTSYDDENFRSIDLTAKNYDYYSEDSNDSYGLNKCLSNSGDNFKERFVSKLYDGKMFCRGRYEAVRVQINESGIGINFGEKCIGADYFALQFKSALDFKQSEPYSHECDLELQITFYKEDEGVYSKEKLKYILEDVPTNIEEYIFFGFTMSGIEQFYGCSVEYKLISDEYNIEHDEKLKHALLLYELLLPNSIWR